MVYKFIVQAWPYYRLMWRIMLYNDDKLKNFMLLTGIELEPIYNATTTWSEHHDNNTIWM